MTNDLIVVVPGILGSVLRKGRRVVWDSSFQAVASALWDFDRIVADLRLPPGVRDEGPDPRHALTPTGLVSGWHVWPGIWAGAGYHGLLAGLRARFSEPGQVLEFAYDWRLSNRYSAVRLKAFVADALGAWREHPARRDAEVAFVCHSMGGLVARHYLDNLGGAETASRLITIGTPYAGSMDAVRALAGDVSPIPRSLISAAAGFPSLRQLLPTYRCVRTETGRVAVDQIGLPGITRDMMADARALQAPLRNRPRPYPIHALGGDRQKTWATAQIVHGTTRYFRTWPSNDPIGGGDPRFVGDGRVPRAAAVPEDWPSDADGIFPVGRHSGLPNQEGILGLLAQKLDPIDRGAALGTDNDVTLDLPDAARADRPVRIAALGSDPGIGFRIFASRPGAPRPKGGVPTRWDGEAHFVELELPAGIWLIEAVAVSGKPRAEMGDLLVVVGTAEDA